MLYKWECSRLWSQVKVDKKITNFDSLPFQVQYLINKTFDNSEREATRENYFNRLVDIKRAIEEVEREYTAPPSLNFKTFKKKKKG